MELSSTHLRYLMAIYDLSLQKQTISSVEVAKALGVKKPSVNKMLENLREKGLVEKARYGKIALTEEGSSIASRYQTQMTRISNHFPEMGLELTREETLMAASALITALPQRYWNAEWT